MDQFQNVREILTVSLLAELDLMFEEFGLSVYSRNTRDSTEVEDSEGWGDDADYEQQHGVNARMERIAGYVDGVAEGDGMEGEDIQSHSDSEVSLTDRHVSCTCKVNCLNQFSSEAIERHILSLREMEKEQKEMYIMGTLQKIGVDETRKGKRKRIRYRFTHDGKTVCKTVFCFINDSGKRTVKALQNHMSLNGAVPRIHGNTGRKPHNALRYADVKYCVEYIVSYAELHGLPMPAGPRGRDEEAPILLPSSLTKGELHREYVKACGGVVIRTLGLTSFKDVWRHCLPHIKIMSPQEDVCQKCEITRKKIAAATSETDKLDAATILREHIQKAQREREQYKASVLEASEEMVGYQRPDGPIPPVSTEFKKVHYTFDYSQGVALPHYSQQMGPLYFITRRKVQIFGIRFDSVPRQYNYLIDEDQTIGTDGTGTHGPNSVLSMLHHALFRYGFGEKACIMHADNCSGQNKNRYVIAYLCWRINQGLHTDITLQMQVPGHTKCLVDAGFGHIKKLFRRSDCDSLGQLANIVQKSAYSNTPVLFHTADGEQTWTWYDWKSFLQQTFLPLKGIRKYHVFRFTDEDKRAVYVRERSGDREIRVEIMKRGAVVQFGLLPQTISPAGLTRTRQEYLYKTVRQYVRPEFQDLVCPALQEE